ncbi:hypothetical protein ACF061_12830 [Streptomyces sp. NPDC015220]|uniref:hypothetical protein n=1 Tax=Streptomyces sp. NPDC015220 TaxID=3364947 RepID=UPI0037019FAA
MAGKQIAVIAATATVFVWSVVMAVIGQVAAVATLAPALGLTVQQIAGATRTRTAPAPRPRVAPTADKEDGAQ